MAKKNKKKNRGKKKALQAKSRGVLDDVLGIINAADSPRKLWKHAMRTVKDHPLVSLAAAALAFTALLDERRSPA